jgi:tRNA threonylcarbamoyl adenosine modification protein (Sua5/YciO/YrdC/YwlC family)
MEYRQGNIEMSQFFQIHPDNPQQRLIDLAVEIINKGGVIVYPTDSGYALGCHIGDKSAMERIRSIRKVDAKHNFTLVCRDLSDIATYAKVENETYRLIKSLTPGPYTFILKATKEVPKRLQNPKRKTIGLRVPDNLIAQALLERLGEPLMSSTLILPGDEMPMTDPYDIRDTLDHALDLIIDGGYCGFEPTTVVELTEDVPVVARVGLGPVDAFEQV